jgi:hypothetical protein
MLDGQSQIYVYWIHFNEIIILSKDIDIHKHIDGDISNQEIFLRSSLIFERKARQR